MNSNVRRQSVTKIKMVKIKFLIYSDGPKVAVRFTVTLNLFHNYILYQKNSNVFISTEQRHVSYMKQHVQVWHHPTSSFIRQPCSFLFHMPNTSLWLMKLIGHIMSWEHPRQSLTPHRSQLHRHDILWQLPTNNLNTIPVHRRFISSEFLNFFLS